MLLLLLLSFLIASVLSVPNSPVVVLLGESDFASSSSLFVSRASAFRISPNFPNSLSKAFSFSSSFSKPKSKPLLLSKTNSFASTTTTSFSTSFNCSSASFFCVVNRTKRVLLALLFRFRERNAVVFLTKSRKTLSPSKVAFSSRKIYAGARYSTFRTDSSSVCNARRIFHAFWRKLMCMYVRVFMENVRHKLSVLEGR